MIYRYVDVANNEELDRVTIEGDKVSYRTGKARGNTVSFLRHYGVEAAKEIMSDWSNGYVKFVEIPE